MHLVLVVMSVYALAHGLVCPGIVNTQRSSAAVDASMAAVSTAFCRSVSRP